MSDKLLTTGDIARSLGVTLERIQYIRRVCEIEPRYLVSPRQVALFLPEDLESFKTANKKIKTMAK